MVEVTAGATVVEMETEAKATEVVGPEEASWGREEDWVEVAVHRVAEAEGEAAGGAAEVDWEVEDSGLEAVVARLRALPGEAAEDSAEEEEEGSATPGEDSEAKEERARRLRDTKSRNVRR